MWAPEAAEVALAIERGPDVTMERDADGWWLPSRSLRSGERYLVRLDGEELPDPASRCQPDGPFGPSEVDDPSSYPWTDNGWVPPPWTDAVLYELHLGTFTPEGTARSAVAHLPHLVDLGVTHVELMPLGTYAGRWGWGYDGVLWSAPHATYGRPDDVRLLVDACHASGLAVVVDVVYNHLGPSGSVLPRFGPYLTSAHSTPWGDAVNLDGPGSEHVRRRILDDALMWIVDYHADGLRIDAIHALVDDSPEHLLAELGRRVEEEVGDRAVLIAETDLHDPRPVVPRERGGHGLTAQWADDLHHAVHAFLTGERQGYYETYDDPGLIATALEDVHTVGTPVGDMPRDAFVVALQNHDQVGNRPRGERLHHQVGVDAVGAAAALFLLGPSVPMLFQGEEWAASSPFPYFADHPELADAIREGRAREFSWADLPPDELPDPGSEATYRSAQLRWDEAAEPHHAEVLDWYRTLLRLRHDHADLGTRGPVEVSSDGGQVTLRRGRFAVVVNLDATRPMGMPSGAVVALSPGAVLTPDLPSHAAAVVELHPPEGS